MYLRKSNDYTKTGNKKGENGDTGILLGCLGCGLASHNSLKMSEGLYLSSPSHRHQPALSANRTHSPPTAPRRSQ